MIWQLIRRGAKGELEQPRPQGAFPWLSKSALGTRLELEVEFKFQRRSCNLSFLSSPRRQRAPEPSLLAGYRLSLWKSLLLQIPDNIYVTMLDTIKQ